MEFMMADNDPQVDKVGNYDWIVESSELISLLTAVLGELSGYPNVCVLGCGTSTLSADLQLATKSVSASTSTSTSTSVCVCTCLELLSNHRALQRTHLYPPLPLCRMSRQSTTTSTA
jgi:hypothetical protein